MSRLVITCNQSLVYDAELSHREPVTIGAHSSNTVEITDADLPQLYARVLWNKRSQQYELASATEDQLLVDGQAAESSLLESGKQYQLGPLQIDFRDESDESAAANPQANQAADEEQPQDDQADSPPETSKKSKSKRKKPVSLTRADRDQDDESVKEWLRKSRRPGEKNAVKSPVVTALTVMSLFLVLGAGGLYLLIGRQTAQIAYQAAKADRDQRKFAQAITKYDLFLSEFPTHKLSSSARIERDLCLIDRSLSGAGVNLEEALTAIDQFIDYHRSAEDFRDWYSTLASYAYRISLDAYRQATRQHDPAFLNAGDQGQQLFGRFKASDGSDQTRENEIELARQEAENSLLQFAVKRESLKELDEQISANEVATAFEVYRRSIARYPVFLNDQEFIDRIKRVLKLEQDGVREVQPLVRQTTLAHDETSTTSVSSPQFVLMHRQVNRLDVTTDQQPIWLLAEGHCYAIDRMTGTPRWQYEVGDTSAFEPIEVTAEYDSWLISTNADYGLALLRKRDGTLLWETTFTEPIICTPTVHDNAVYVLTRNQQLTILQLETGEAIRTLEFPQTITAPVTVLEPSTLCCVARQDVVYLIDRQTWECQDVKYYGHAADSITQRPQSIASRLLLAENDQLRRGRLQVIDPHSEDWKLPLIHEERLPGLALGAPVLWGDRLFVEMNGPQIAAWQLSDIPGDPFLNRITNATIPATQDIRLSLYPVEGDRLLVAGENLRSLTLLTSSFEQQQASIDLGQSSQSIQGHGPHVYLAGQQSPHTGHKLLHYDHQAAESFWQIKLGAQPIVIKSTGNRGRLICVNSLGHLYEFNSTSLQPLSWLEPRERLFPNQTDRLLAEGILVGPASLKSQLAIASGQTIKILNQAGVLQETLNLPEACQTPPVISDGVTFWCGASGLYANSIDKSISAIAPWQAADTVEQSAAPDWKQLLLASENHLLALNGDQTLLGFSVRQEPTRHLAQTGQFQAEHSVAGLLLSRSGQLLMTTSEDSLLIIDPESLILSDTLSLPGTPTAGPWEFNGRIYLELNDQQIVCYDSLTNQGLRWRIDLETSLGCQPVLQDDQHLILCLNDGHVRILNLDTGEQTPLTVFHLRVPCPPVVNAETITFALSDGTIRVIPRSTSPDAKDVASEGQP